MWTRLSQRQKGLTAKMPEIGDNGNWWTWDIETEQYTDGGRKTIAKGAARRNRDCRGGRTAGRSAPDYQRRHRRRD